jgi:DNA-directed RNA polymerase subunit RPC12/RpoP
MTCSWITLLPPTVFNFQQQHNPPSLLCAQHVPTKPIPTAKPQRNAVTRGAKGTRDDRVHLRRYVPVLPGSFDHDLVLRRLHVERCSTRQDGELTWWPDCGAKTPMRQGEQIRCKECGHRVLYKPRTHRSESLTICIPGELADERSRMSRLLTSLSQHSSEWAIRLSAERRRS